MAFKIQDFISIYDDEVIRVGNGTEAERPANPELGMIRYNTDIDAFEGYTHDGWVMITDENWVPPSLSYGFGTPYGGGIYMGTICAAGTCYALIVAPNATGCAFCQWKTTNTATAGAGSLVDGYANTYGPMDNATHPAGNWTATRTIGGFSDWYLPAIDELETFYNNGATGDNESVIGVGEAFASTFYWSSTESSVNTPWGLSFGAGGRFDSILKSGSRSVRAVRRVPI